VKRVISLSENILLCSYILTSFLQSEYDDNGSTSHPSTWFSILDSDTVQYQCSKKGNVLVRLTAGNTEPSLLCNIF
jgi:hypothetical protein